MSCILQLFITDTHTLVNITSSVCSVPSCTQLLRHMHNVSASAKCCVMQVVWDYICTAEERAREASELARCDVQPY